MDGWPELVLQVTYAGNSSASGGCQQRHNQHTSLWIYCVSQVTHEACRAERTRERGYLPASERVPVTATVAVTVLLILRWAIVLLCLATATAPLRLEEVVIRATGESSRSMLMDGSVLGGGGCPTSVQGWLGSACISYAGSPAAQAIRQPFQTKSNIEPFDALHALFRVRGRDWRRAKCRLRCTMLGTKEAGTRLPASRRAGGFQSACLWDATSASSGLTGGSNIR